MGELLCDSTSKQWVRVARGRRRVPKAVLSRTRLRQRLRLGEKRDETDWKEHPTNGRNLCPEPRPSTRQWRNSCRKAGTRPNKIELFIYQSDKIETRT